METRTISSLEELQILAGGLLTVLSHHDQAQVLALTGDLGAGKTALVKALAKHLGVEEDITSPTFVIMKSYPIPNHIHFKTLVHIDAYRIDDIDEMRVLKFEDLLRDRGSLIAIEWPERILPLIPKDAFPVTITIAKEMTRTITYGT